MRFQISQTHRYGRAPVELNIANFRGVTAKEDDIILIVFNHQYQHVQSLRRSIEMDARNALLGMESALTRYNDYKSN